MSAMDVDSVPAVLWPMLLRSGSRYRSLRRYHFTQEEKIWICKNLVFFCDDLDNDLNKKIKSFGKRYDLSSKLIVSWLDIFASGAYFEVPGLDGG